MYRLLWHKIAFLIVLAFAISFNSIAQTQNLPRFEWRRMHFGFTLGTTIPNFKYEFSENFYTNDSIAKVSIGKFPGITLGAISDLHFGEFFDLRVIPSLVLAERRVTYDFYSGYKTTKNIESIFVELPVHVKYKSVRHTNIRFYVIGGGKISYDFGSNYKAHRDPNNPILSIDPVSYAYEFGCGLDMYFEWFKFSPEIKLSKGINNILTPYDDVYSNIFDKFNSNFIFISFHFEG